MQRWEPVDPAELARTSARKRHTQQVRMGRQVGWGLLAVVLSCAFWTVLVAAYVIGQR